MVSLLFTNNKKIFDEKALEILRKGLLKKGFVLSNMEGLEETIEEIGELYHELRKKEKM